ncbi:MAG: DUF4825 domain-containing protein [Clostridiales bacterium]|nr:DUF4825 domain-containing protein [Clostridiales bacterium]
MAICLARLPLKKAPKIITYCLWTVAGFRLVFPFSIESVFGLIPFKAQTIPADIALQQVPRIDSGIPFVNNAVSSILPAATPAASVNPLQIWTTIGAFVWLIGGAVMLIYGIVSFVILKRKMREAVHIEANIYEAENIQSPFVLGVFKPKIYLPASLSSQERSYILLHEQTHIRRHDHIVKFAAYFILCLHWFNPLAWVAFLLMGVDMELSCDERVLKQMGGEIKRDYSLSLLSLATERRIIGGSPLAFGEGSVKERIKNVLNFKKPSRVIIAAAVALAAVLSVGFAVNKAAQIHDPQSFNFGTFALENANEDQKAMHMTSFTLDGSGVATFHTAPISSYIPPKCTFAVEDGDLVFRAIIQTEQDQSFFGLDDNSIVAIFSVINENTLVFKSANVVLVADAGAKYTLVTQDALYSLSALRTPYVGNNSAVGKIINFLPRIDWEHAQRFFSIGDDYGTGNAPYTLTIYYEPNDAETSNIRNITVTPKNSVLLFSLIDNLEEVNYAFRSTPSDGELDKEAYISHVTYSKNDIAEYLKTIGLEWEDFGNDWNGSVEKMYAAPSVSEPQVLTIEDVRTLAKKGDSLLFEDVQKYKGANVSSNLDNYIMVYGVEGGYRLIVRSDQSGKPDSVNLESIWASGGGGIDIRYGDIDEFLRKWPIIMQVKNGTATPSGATVTLKNVTDTEYTYGESYTVQRKTDSGWVDVEPVIEDYGFDDIAYTLPAMGNKEIIVDWEWLYGKLPAGDYRMVKEALFVRAPGDYDTFTLYTAFTIVK